MSRSVRSWSLWRRPVVAAAAAVMALTPFPGGAQSQPGPMQEERFAIIRMGVGLEKRTGHTRGTPGDCISGSTVEVSVTVGSGALGNRVKGKAKCGRLAVVPSVSISDPGNSAWAFVIAGGSQVSGNPTCGFSYEGTETPVSAWMVVCRFF